MVYFFIQKTFQNFGEKLCLQIKCTCVIFIVYALVVAVLPDPKTADNSLHWSEAGTYMCWPVLVPQITGGAEIKIININNQFVTLWSWITKKWKLHFAPGAVIVNVSTSQFPKLFAVPDQRCWLVLFFLKNFEHENH